MKNEVICKSCGAANPFHQLVCLNCKTYLRERVYNLDLWKILGNLIESPTNAFSKIIYSEQKNFIIFIIILASLKFYLNTFFFFLANPSNNLIASHFSKNYPIILGVTIIVIFVFSLIVKLTLNIFGNKCRLKDVNSLLIFSLVPNVFALAILFPIEIIFFGGYLFSNNPSPFIIKEITAYIMLSLEILIVLWTIFLSIIAMFTLTRNKFYSISVGLFYILAVYFSQYLLSQNLY